MSRTSDFLNNLYAEKENYKNRRHDFVLKKLLFTAGIIGVGNLGTEVNFIDANLETFLYFIPAIILPFDAYIYAADYKVKRVGVFIRKNEHLKINITEDDNIQVCRNEVEWEKFVDKFRENRAEISSIVLSIIVFIASAVLLITDKNGWTPPPFGWKIFKIWATCSVIFGIIVYIYCNRLTRKTKKSEYWLEHGVEPKLSLINRLNNWLKEKASIQKLRKKHESLKETVMKLEKEKNELEKKIQKQKNTFEEPNIKIPPQRTDEILPKTKK